MLRNNNQRPVGCPEDRASAFAMLPRTSGHLGPIPTVRPAIVFPKKESRVKAQWADDTYLRSFLQPEQNC